MLIGKMLQDVSWSGNEYGMVLCKDMIVELEPAKNLHPAQRTWFYARPVNGLWKDGVFRDEKDTLLIEPSDVEIIQRPYIKETYDWGKILLVYNDNHLWSAVYRRINLDSIYNSTYPYYVYTNKWSNTVLSGSDPLSLASSAHIQYTSVRNLRRFLKLSAAGRDKRIIKV